MAHPFKPGNATLLAVVTSVLLTGIIHIDDLRFSQYAPFSASHTLFTFVHLLLLTLLLYFYCFYLFRKLTGEEALRSSSRTTVWAIVGTLVIAFVFSIASMWVGRHVFPSLGIDARIDISLIKDGFVALNVILITILLYNLTRHQQQVLEEERTHTESIQTRYDALEKQIDPHFLFNSLNTLDGLIGFDDGRAHDYLHQLALSYRYIMQQQRLVTLADEMRFTDNFIAMMQIRYGDNLRVEKHIQEQCLSAMVVPISVQLLVENALQHNVVSDRYPLTVTITTVCRSGEDGSELLGIMVSNPLQPRSDAEEGAHGSIGLNNLSQRCQLVLHRDIVIRQTDTVFEVEIPVELIKVKGEK
jgi:sensor histidine kinase YesM